MSRLLARIVGVLLTLAPRDFRARFGREIVDDLERAIRDAAHSRGAVAMFGLWGRGIIDAMKTVFRERHLAAGEPGHRSSLWADLCGDLKYALRGWRRSPGFSVTVVVTLALGLGLMSAIFAFADGYLFRQLPFPGGDRAFLVRDPNARIASALSAFDLAALRQSPVAEFGFVEWSSATVSGDAIVAGRSVPVTGASVSPGFQQTLRLPLVTGREFTPDDHVEGAPVVGWLTDRFWRVGFQRNVNVVGTVLRIEQPRSHVDVLVVGVLSPEVTSFELNNRPPDLVMPERGPPSTGPNDLAFPIVVLPEGVSVGQGAQRIAAVLQSVAPAGDGRPRVVQLRSMLEAQVSGGRPTAKVFLAGGSLVLLLASLNLIHLLVGRNTSRMSEVVTRVALGASRWRVLRVFMVESLLFGVVGIAAGLLGGRLLSWWIASRLPQFPTKGRNLSLVAMLFDERAVIVAVSLGLVVAMIGGLWPALLAIRGPLAIQERSDGRVRRMTSGRLARMMLMSELAVASAVLVGVVFVGLGVHRYLNQPLGYQLKGRFQIYATQPDGRPVKGIDALAAADAVRQVSGVEAASLRHVGQFTEVSAPPSTLDVTELLDGDDRLGVPTLSVNAGYFDTWGVTIRAGRWFNPSEHPDNGTVAMVTERLARLLWPGVDPIGKPIRAGDSIRTVVGVIQGMLWSLEVEREAAVYVPAAQGQGSTFLIAHVPRATVGSVGPQLEAAVRRVVPSATVRVKPFTYESMMERPAGEAQFQGPFVIIFGVLAVTLAGVGVFGLVSYVVEQRTREFGIRIALGAKLSDIWRTVMRESLQPTFIGLVLGSAGALALESVVQSSVFGWKSSGPMAVAIVAAGLMIVAVIAAVIPAGRATRVDPATTLRAE